MMMRKTDLFAAMAIATLSVPIGSVAAEKTAAGALPTWTRLGGIPGGAFGKIAFDPNNPAIMFVGAGSAGGAIFRSADGGATFQETILGAVQTGVRAIAIDPKNSKIVFASTTDDYNAGVNGALYESQDGGLTWAKLAHQPIGTGPGPTTVGNGRGLFISSNGATLVVADKRQGVYYSSNQGVTWTNPLPRAAARCYALVPDPSHAANLWAGGYDATDNFNGVLWKSTNTGKSWTKVTIGALDQTKSPLPLAIAVIPKTGKLLVSWFGQDPDTGATVGGIVASLDGGTTWADSSSGLPANYNTGNSLVVDPVKPTTVYATANGLPYPQNVFRSLDSGATWAPLGAAVGGADGMFTAAARPAKAGVPAAVFVGGDLFKSTDGGATWARTDNGINIGAVQQVREDGLTAGGLYASTADGLFHSADGGQSWTRISTWGGAVAPRAIEVDPVSANHDLYVSTQSGLWRSADAGETWTALPSPVATGVIGYLLADPTVAGRLSATDSANGFFHSTNFGMTWKKSTVGIDGDLFTASPAPVIFDPARSSIVYAAMTSGLWKSTNSGVTWIEETALHADPGNLLSIAALPAKNNALFAETGYTPSGGAFGVSLQESIHGGSSWSTLGSPFAAIDPNAANDPFHLTIPPAGGAVFAYGYQGQIVRSPTGASGGWGVVDSTIASQFGNTAAAYSSATRLYAWDVVGSGAAFVAPLASLTTTAISPASASRPTSPPAAGLAP